MNIITSPPFSQPETRDRTPVQAGSVGNQFSRKTPGAGGAYTVDRQTMTEGNIARLSIIGSPPYAESLKPETPEQTARKQQRIATAKSVHDGRTLEKPSAGKAGLGGGYGSTPGQIGSMKGGSMTTRAIDIPTEQWYGCYDEGWGDLIVPDAYAHPAKMARGLAYKIVREGLNRNWWSKQSIIADPFGGIGTTGLVCAAHGIQAHLCELEQKFVDLARQNFELHRKQWEALGLPVPTITQGDSRRLSEVLTTAGHVMTSPPFMDVLNNAKMKVPHDSSGRFTTDYGHTPGQIGAMSSPPYGGTRFDGGPSETGQFGAGYRPTGNYSQDKANIGNEDDYWGACASVYRECYKIMTPGAHACLVVKGYVKKGKYVDLPAQTLDLLLSLGFQPVLWVDAMLVAAESQPGLLDDTQEYRKERKSFFRRLAEAKGSPRIDAEIVLVVKKGGE